MGGTTCNGYYSTGTELTGFTVLGHWLQKSQLSASNFFKDCLVFNALLLLVLLKYGLCSVIMTWSTSSNPPFSCTLLLPAKLDDPITKYRCLFSACTFPSFYSCCQISPQDHKCAFSERFHRGPEFD